MTPWSEEDIATLKYLWVAGLSASQIARQLTVKKSRNAVIGKVHRLGLAGNVDHRINVKASFTSISNGQKSTKPKRKTIIDSLPVEPLPKEDTPPDKLIAIDDLEPHHCRWVYGDPKHEHGFCGKQQVIGLPYCIDHARRAFQAPQPKVRLNYVPLAARVFA